MLNDIDETCGECHYFVKKSNFSCCHLNPPMMAITSIDDETATGKRSWWTFPYVNHDEVACSKFVARREGWERC